MRLVALSILLAATTARADSTSGIDSALFRSSYDSNGLTLVEGARLLAPHDFSFKLVTSYGFHTLDLAVPGIGDASADRVLDQLLTLDLAFGMTLSKRLAIGFDVGAYRTEPGAGYGVRGRYMSGNLTAPSTGVIALRPLSNIDPSAASSDPSSYLGDERAGPLDARVGAKLALFSSSRAALTLIGSVRVPFGDEEMLLGDRGFVFEPTLAFELTDKGPAFLAIGPWRPAKTIANVGLRIRRRSVLESYDTSDPAATAADAKVFLDLGNQLVLAVGRTTQVTPRFSYAFDLQLLLGLPGGEWYGTCRRFDGTRCSSLSKADYFGSASATPSVVLGTAGVGFRLSTDLALQVSLGLASGALGDSYQTTLGLAWQPQPAGTSMPTKRDRDGDGIPDSLDACPSEPEDKDGWQDEDGCPDADNDRDGLLDGDDKCPDQAEDKDGFEDGDGCPELDNDQDGIPDNLDRCPDQAEDKDNFEDDDGCPELDNDKDGIPDDKDQCPNDPGSKANDGCPERGRP